VGLERGPHSLVSTTEELLDRKVTEFKVQFNCKKFKDEDNCFSLVIFEPNIDVAKVSNAYLRYLQRLPDYSRILSFHSYMMEPKK
jgi:hypothetical protein